MIAIKSRDLKRTENEEMKCEVMNAHLTLKGHGFRTIFLTNL